MMRTLSFILMVGASFLCLVSCSAPAENTASGVTSLDDFDRGTLFIDSDDGQRHEIVVYLALSAEQQRRGLMFVRNMSENNGMLFVYEKGAIRSMWMKNTYIPLDMVFAREDGSVSSIIHNTQPLSLTSQSSIEAVIYVLELNAGTARRLNIGRKSRITRATPDAVEE